MTHCVENLGTAGNTLYKITCLGSLPVAGIKFPEKSNWKEESVYLAQLQAVCIVHHAWEAKKT